MSAPSAPIDADLGEWDKISYFVLEEGAIWRTQNLKEAGAATWTQVWDSASFGGGTFGALMRLRCAPGTPSQIVYALGWGENDATGDKMPFILRSENNGLTWSQIWLDVTLTERDYTTVRQNYLYHRTGGWAVGTTLTIPRLSGFSVLAMAYTFEYLNPVGDCRIFVNGLGSGDATDYMDGSRGTNPAASPTGFANGIYGYNNAACEAVLTDYFGSWSRAINGSINMPDEDARIYVDVGFDGIGWTYPANPSDTLATVYIFWDKPSVVMPKALDVARANPNVLFIGLQDKIITSIDGGFNWTILIDTHGAYDICVDPQLGGVIYYWSTDGELRCAIAGVPQAALLTGETGGEDAGFLRIARDFNTGKIWAVHNGDLKLRNLGSWSTQKSGLVQGRGLKAFYASPTKLAVLDDSDIYLSLDAGATWANKKGGWSGYAAPKTIHLLE